MSILEALMCTLAIETLFFPLLSNRKKPLYLGLFILMNTVTNTGMNLLYIYVFDADYLFIPAAEIFVFLIESLILYRLDGRRVRSFWVGIMANGGSFLIGIAVNGLIQNATDLSRAALVFSMVFLIELLFILAYQSDLLPGIRKRLLKKKE